MNSSSIVSKAKKLVKSVSDNASDFNIMTVLKKASEDPKIADVIINTFAEEMPSLNDNAHLYKEIISIRGTNGRNVLCAIFDDMRSANNNKPFLSYFKIEKHYTGSDILPSSLMGDNPLEKLCWLDDNIAFDIMIHVSSLEFDVAQAIYGDLIRHLMKSKDVNLHKVLSNIELNDSCVDAIEEVGHINELVSEGGSIDEMLACIDSFEFNITASIINKINKADNHEHLFDNDMTVNGLLVLSGLTKKSPVDLLMMDIPEEVKGVALNIISDS